MTNQQKPYGCHNKPRPTPQASYIAQDGWHEFIDGRGNPVRTPKWKEVNFNFSTDCDPGKRAIDPRCASCQHGGEK